MIPDQENGCCYCLVEESGERTFMSYHGAEYTFQKEWMDPYDSKDFGLTYVCGIEVEEPTDTNILEYLEEHPDLRIFFAPGPRLKHIEPEKIDRILALHPMLHINEQEALSLSRQTSVEAAAKHLHALTQNAVIITLGERGCFCTEENGNHYLIPSVPAQNLVDTIGAGDSHAGAIIACLTMGLPLRDAVTYANKVSAAVVCVNGIGITKEQLPKMQK